MLKIIQTTTHNYYVILYVVIRGPYCYILVPEADAGERWSDEQSRLNAHPQIVVQINVNHDWE